MATDASRGAADLHGDADEPTFDTAARAGTAHAQDPSGAQISPLRLDLRSDHPLGLLLLRSALERAGYPQGPDRCSWTQTAQPAHWQPGARGLAVCVGPAALRSPISIALPALRLRLYASASFARQHDGFPWPAELDRHLVLDLDLDAVDAPWLLRSSHAELKLERAAATQRTRDPIQAQAFATSGLGLAWLPAPLVGAAVRSGQLVECLQGKWYREASPLHVSLPPGHRASRKVLNIVQAMCELLDG